MPYAVTARQQGREGRVQAVVEFENEPAPADQHDVVKHVGTLYRNMYGVQPSRGEVVKVQSIPSRDAGAHTQVVRGAA